MSLLAGISGVLVLYMTKTLIYVPGALAANQTAGQLVAELAQGHDLIPGAMYATEMPIAESNRIRYRAVDQAANGTLHWVEVSYDPVQKKISRSIDGGTAETLPPFTAKGIVVQPAAGQTGIFEYYDRNGNPLTPPVDNHAWIVYCLRIGLSTSATGETTPDMPTTSEAVQDIYLSFSR